MPRKRPDRTIEEDLRQLKNSLSLLKQASRLLDETLAGWSVPDGPEQPPFIDTLNSIKNEATECISVADRLLATMKT
jgi:hypothetical protein